MTGDDSGRREFVKGGLSAAAGVFTILKPALVRGSAANSAIRVGLLGCGNRGSTDAASIAQHTDARIVAVADLFQDRIERAKQRFDKLAASKGYAGIAQSFAGAKSAEQLFQSKEVDAVVIATPAWFHPGHLAGAVAGGKHIYLEKPVAVDVAGAKRILEIANRIDGKLNLDVGFQIRSAPPFVELVRRIHGGALGDIVSAEAHYYAPMPNYPDYPNASPQELRIRNWWRDRALSGDIIVEQNIHALDICNWVLKATPLRATGRGGKKGRGERGGDVYSHFDVVFEYPHDVHVSFSSVQFGKGKFDVSERFFGTRGASVSPYSGALGIDGEEAWTWSGSERQPGAEFSASGSFTDNLAAADSEKHKGFIAAIAGGSFHNQAAQGVDSVLTAILGRQAAYTGREITWDHLQRSNEHWESGIVVEKLG